MALFVVNRYLGETNENNSKDEQDGLQKLLEKIEERKKRKLLESTSTDLDDDSNKNLNRIASDKNATDHKTKKTRKKDKKLSQLKVSSTFKKEINEKDETDLLENELDEKSTKEKKKIKKDKKKRKLSESDAQISETEKDDNTIKDKQRKKKFKNSESNEILRDKVKLNDIPSDNSISEEDSISHSSAQNIVDIEQTDFTVIGGHNFKQKTAIKVVLPEWISKPIVMSGTFKDKYAKVKDARGLDDVIINNLKKNNIKYFFPVQQQVIPWLLNETKCSGPGLRFWPRDVCISAPTGSGKTLAFALPIIQSLRKRLIRRIGALVIVPVQDLAAQVAQVFCQFTAGTGLQVLLVTGKAMPLEQERKLLVHHRVGLGYESLIDIMVTTPGRLVEHIKETRGFSLHHLKFLVIDEADRVVDNIKNDWLYHLENHIASKGIGAIPPLSLNTLEQLPLRPQKLLFSATFTDDPEKLKQIHLFQPRLFVYKTENQVDVNSVDTKELVPNLIVKPSQLEEQWLECSLQLKPLVLYHILTANNWSGVLCFTHIKSSTHRLTRLLHFMGVQNGRDLKVEEISSEVTFQNRIKILNEFRAGKIDVLVCSDVFARGMDILEVRYVVLYSPPGCLRNYIHQVGRTARAGMKGTALTLLTSSEVDTFHKMVKGNSNLTELTVPKNELMYLEDSYKEALHLVKEEFRRDKESATEKTKLQKRERKRKNFVQHPRRKKRSTNSIKKLKQNFKTIKKKKLK